MKEIGNRSEGGGKSGVVQLMEVGKNTCSLSGVQCQRFKDHHQLHLHLFTSTSMSIQSKGATFPCLAGLGLLHERAPIIQPGLCAIILLLHEG